MGGGSDQEKEESWWEKLKRILRVYDSGFESKIFKNMITLQVGQCGNQVGTSLYDTITNEIVETKYSEEEEEVLAARRTFFRESKEKLVSRSVLVDVRIFYSDRRLTFLS